jgi:mannobiose 2-epimerase
MKTNLLLTALIAPSLVLAQSKQDRLQIENEMEYSLQNELLNKWYPQSIDTTYGGFISTYTYDFKSTGTQDKFIVTQARHTWTTAKASENGFYFLRDLMWDKTYCGFHNLVNRFPIRKSLGCLEVLSPLSFHN